MEIFFKEDLPNTILAKFGSSFLRRRLFLYICQSRKRTTYGSHFFVRSKWNENLFQENRINFSPVKSGSNWHRSFRGKYYLYWPIKNKKANICHVFCQTKSKWGFFVENLLNIPPIFDSNWPSSSSGEDWKVKSLQTTDRRMDDRCQLMAPGHMTSSKPQGHGNPQQ